MTSRPVNPYAKAKKDSSNSAKPPSSDIVNAKKAANKKRKRKRKPGGRKGHPKHARPDFPPESINETWEYYLKSCPLCGGGLEDADRAPRVVRQVDIIDVPIRIEAHRGRAYGCPSCQKFHYAPLPREVEQGQLFGPRLTTFHVEGGRFCYTLFAENPKNTVSHGHSHVTRNGITRYATFAGRFDFEAAGTCWRRRAGRTPNRHGKRSFERRRESVSIVESRG